MSKPRKGLLLLKGIIMTPSNNMPETGMFVIVWNYKDDIYSRAFRHGDAGVEAYDVTTDSWNIAEEVPEGIYYALS